MVSTELQRAMAHKIGAATQSLAADHLPMLSQPARVAAFIMEAAQQLESVESVRISGHIVLGGQLGELRDQGGSRSKARL